jgi:hypothetical protein
MKNAGSNSEDTIAIEGGWSYLAAEHTKFAASLVSPLPLYFADCG